MTVRAKFICTQETISAYRPDEKSFKFNAVAGGSEENKRFYKYTPGGEFELKIANAEAAAYFKLGKEYYIDFTEATS